MKNSQIHISIVCSIIGLAFLLGLQFRRLNALRTEIPPAGRVGTAEQSDESTFDREQLTLQRYLPTFGFRNLFSNWTFFNFLVYFGDEELRAETGYQLSPEFFEIIVDQDPYFIDSYLFLSGSTTLYAGQPERSVQLVERGLKSLAPNRPPRAYLAWRYKATDELLFLGRTNAAQASYETAAMWASLSSDPEAVSIAKISQQTAAFLAQNPDSRAAQINAWFSILSSGLDEQAQALALRRIEELGGIVEVLPSGAVQVQIPEE